MVKGEKQAQTVKVPAKDLTEEQKRKKEEKDKVPVSQRPTNEGLQLDEVEDMSEEDRLLKETLEALVEDLKAPSIKESAFKTALDTLRKEIQTSTSTMTSVPKPLKFLRPYYEDFKKLYETTHYHSCKPHVADIISVLAMTYPNDELASLRYKLLGAEKDIGAWGHEFVRNISGEIARDYLARSSKGENVDDLLSLVDEIVPYDMKHNSEAEACDLLLEVDRLDMIQSLVTIDNHSRVCLYLLRMSSYVVDNEELDKILGVAFSIYMQCGKYPDALRVAIRLDDPGKQSEVFAALGDSDEGVKKQMGFILGSHKLVMEEFMEDDDMMEIIGNANLHDHYLALAKDLEVLEAKTPEDIYKTHLENNSALRRHMGGTVDSAKQNLASTFVNSFVNCGFSKDLLMSQEGSEWVYKNKEHGMISAIASLGMIYLWDLDMGFEAVDKYTYHNQSFFRAGAFLATGLVSNGVTSEVDGAFALLADHVESGDKDVKIAVLLGIGFAYAGSAREDILDLLCSYIADDELSMEICCMAALALGFVFVGTCNDQISGSILETLMTRTDTELRQSVVRYMSLGLGLLFLGKGEMAEAIVEALKIIEHPVRRSVELCVELCAFAGTGNVLQVQKYLSVVGEHLSEADEPAEGEAPAEEAKEGESAEKKDVSQAQGIAVLGIAAAAMGESLGSQMALRQLENILQYCETNVREAVPLAMGLLNASYPNISVMETLSKLSHDSDEAVSRNAVIALGFIGAGTNNSRIAQLLRQLAVYYAKEPNHLFLVRIAQGLLHLGKGLLTINPFHSDGLLMSKVGLCGLFTVLLSMLDGSNTILGKRHYLLYSLACAVRPRMLVTLDEELKPLPVSVRVGQSVDTVGQAGKPRTITGFQTHTTPVVLGYGERAELVGEDYEPLTSILEGFVILRKKDVEMSED